MLRTMIDNVPDLMYVKDRDSRFMVANNSVTRIMGAGTPEDLLGKNDFDFYPKEIATPFYQDEQRLLQSGEVLLAREDVHRPGRKPGAPFDDQGAAPGQDWQCGCDCRHWAQYYAA